jgi:hypothetical protein
LFVYLIVFWLLAIAALLMELKLTQKARLALLVLSYLLLVLFAGLRWETGNDWPGYFEYYKHLTSLHDVMHNNSDSFDIGYKIVSLFTKDIGLPYAGFNLLYAMAYLGLIFLSFKHENFNISGWLVLQLFAPFILGLMGTARQMMAVAICMFSVRYLLSKDWRKFLICVAIAATFHISALIFLVAWPLALMRLSIWRVYIILVALVIASAANFGATVIEYGVTYVQMLHNTDLDQKLLSEEEATPGEFHYAAGADISIWRNVSRIGVLVLCILAFPLFRDESDRLYIKLYLASFLLVFLLSGPVFVLAERASIYFSIFQIHLLALPTRRLNRRWMRQLYCVALLALSLSRLWTGIYLIRPRVFVPYKGVFINQDVKRDLGWIY